MTILYKSPKYSTKKTSELISEISIVAWYNRSIQKSTVLLHANNDLWEIKKKLHLQLHQKSKIRGINLTKKVKDLYSEKYDTDERN